MIDKTFRRPKLWWIRWPIARFRTWLMHLRYPKSIWYGGSISREDALQSVRPGWARLINNLYDAKPKWVRVVQVKEKFAGLRFYTFGCPDWYEDLIGYYSLRSETICEECGKKGKVRQDLGWWLTLCTEHYKEHKDRLRKETDEGHGN